MTADLVARGPLHGHALPEGIRELPFPAQLDLRLDPGDRAARTAVEAVVGPLPIEPNTAHGGPDAAVLWLGPDEWLLVGPAGSEAALKDQLRDALGGAAPRVAIVDVSANRAVIEIARPDVRDLLAGGCPIDLDPRAFGAGRCAQTLLARANVLLHAVAAEPEPVIRVFVRPSFARYVADWLADAVDLAGG